MPSGMVVQHFPLTGRVIGAALEVHRHLGPGLLESAYDICLAHELATTGISFRRQVSVPFGYKGVDIPVGYRVDFVVGDELLVEIKAVDRILPLHQARIITYLRLLKLRQGLLINFNVARLVNGLKSFMNDPAAGLPPPPE